MHVRSLRLRDFRAHVDSRFEFGPGLNLLHGPNGVGKTNVLEALHFCCLGRSFVTTSDQYALRRGASFFDVEAEIALDSRADATVRIAYVPGEGKRLSVNGAPLDRLVDAVGRFPVVALSPDDHRLTDGGPEERRRFMDVILCQESPNYLDSLLRYRRALRQRNELLARSKGRFVDPSVLAPWDEELARHGSRITLRRRDFIHRFVGMLGDAYRTIEREAERPTMRYRPFVPSPGPDEDAVIASFREILSEKLAMDRDRGVTHAGPHRDEVVFRLDDLDVRRYASHGQHRTFVLALKLAQYRYLHDRLGEAPVFLLDDVFDNLDPKRIGLFAEVLTGEAGGQSLITAARSDLFGAAIAFAGKDHRSIRVAAQVVVGDAVLDKAYTNNGNTSTPERAAEKSPNASTGSPNVSGFEIGDPGTAPSTTDAEKSAAAGQTDNPHHPAETTLLP